MIEKAFFASFLPMKNQSWWGELDLNQQSTIFTLFAFTEVILFYATILLVSVAGIEPAPQRPERRVLPLYYTEKSIVQHTTKITFLNQRRKNFFADHVTKWIDVVSTGKTNHNFLIPSITIHT